MATYTHTAGDVINAVIQDGQVQTTNRTALLDYVNRTSLRILRETNWMFLQSDFKKFITKTGVDKYWIGPGTAPNGYSNTGLALTDAESILPGSVFDVTNALALTQDAAAIRLSRPFLEKDGTTILGQPRGYACYQTQPNTIHLFPPPDNQNYYFPIPEPSYCQNVTGGVLPGRTYYGVSTFVDTQGGEGTQSKVFSQTIPSGSLLMVASPEAEVPSALSPQYAFWNVYIGGSEAGPFYKQNYSPIPIGSPWIEAVSGANPVAPLSQSIPLASTGTLGVENGVLYNITVDSSGILHTTPANIEYNPFPVYVLDPYKQVWALSINDIFQVIATMVPFAQISSNYIIADSSGGAWEITINDVGQLVTTSVGLASAYTVNSVQPPSEATLAPLEGYIIAFRYAQVKQAITSAESIFQIPDAYFDIIVAGVNYYANLYTAKGDDENLKAPIWKKEFMEGLAQIRRDLRINYKNSDYMSPDRTTQFDQYKSVWVWTI